MFSINSVALLSFLLHSLLLCLPVCAVPLHMRQAGNPPRTVSTVSTAVSPMGTFIVSCQYVFTPVKDEQGKDVVREVKTCTLALSGSPSSEGTNITITSTTSSSISTSTATLPSTISTSSSSSSPTPTPKPTPSPPDPVGGSFYTTTESIPTTSTETIPTTSTIPPPDTLTTPTSEEIPTSSTIPPTDTPVGVSGISAAAESAMPGKKLAVLPIGLGVFAGISVIALIVVGIVTYERTKYRKVFRKHKLAEEGAQMGYGGMVY